MKRAIVALGTLTLILASADLIHGQHNGDVHRYYIHVAEFVSLLCLLCLSEVQAFRMVSRKTRYTPWLTSVLLSVGSCITGFVLFGLAGGSFEGDGGPLAAAFGVLGFVGMLAVPVSLIGFLIATAMRRINTHRRTTR